LVLLYSLCLEDDGPEPVGAARDHYTSLFDPRPAWQNLLARFPVWTWRDRCSSFPQANRPLGVTIRTMAIAW
jgi:hypothetical protein